MIVIFLFKILYKGIHCNIGNPILKINDSDFSIQDSMQEYPLQSWLQVVLRVLRNKPQID
jgi:hypothetical protein